MDKESNKKFHCIFKLPNLIQSPNSKKITFLLTKKKYQLNKKEKNKFNVEKKKHPNLPI